MKTFVAVSLFVAFVALARADDLVELEDDAGKVGFVVSYLFCYFITLSRRPNTKAILSSQELGLVRPMRQEGRVNPRVRDKMNCSLYILFHVSRNSTVFYLKSANLIGSPTVFYSSIENDRALVAL